MAKALSMSETLDALGISRRTFYDRAKAGDATVVFLLQRCMRKQGAKGARRRWAPEDVKAAQDMERGVSQRRRSA